MADTIMDGLATASTIGALGGLLIVFSLSACGGGSGSGSATAPPSFPPAISLARVAGGLATRAPRTLGRRWKRWKRYQE
jgi:hypothetical protein